MRTMDVIDGIPYESRQAAELAVAAIESEAQASQDAADAAESEASDTAPYDADGALRALVAAMPQVLDAIPEHERARMAGFVAAWEPDGMPYALGAYVRHDEAVWRVTQAHTSQPDWPPGVAVSLFARQLAVAGDGPAPWEHPGSTSPYGLGDRVTHGGQVWESMVDDNVWEPGAVGTGWLWEVVG